MRAHDVRHLTFCLFCEGIGDDRTMIRLASGRTHYVDGRATGIEHDYAHGRCYLTFRSEEEVLRLPPEERGKFSIKDAGPELARLILESL